MRHVLAMLLVSRIMSSRWHVPSFAVCTGIEEFRKSATCVALLNTINCSCLVETEINSACGVDPPERLLKLMPLGVQVTLLAQLIAIQEVGWVFQA